MATHAHNLPAAFNDGPVTHAQNLHYQAGELRTRLMDIERAMVARSKGLNLPVIAGKYQRWDYQRVAALTDKAQDRLARRWKSFCKLLMAYNAERGVTSATHSHR